MDARSFEMFGLPHCVAMAATAVASGAMVWLNRSSRFHDATKQKVNVVLAWVLIVAVFLDPVLAWLRYGANAELATKLIREVALPFYLCDIVSLVLGVALITRRQRWAELGYLWGMAGTVQGLITPTLYFSWDTAEYYVFFAQHGGVPVAALTLAFGTNLKPQPGAFWRAVLWSWVYIGGVYFVNLALGANYGFVNHKPNVPTLFDYMGPYPWYLLTVQAIAFSLYLLLLIPFRLRKSSSPG